jgi:methylase of polypeptide subunit release factors
MRPHFDYFCVRTKEAMFMIDTSRNIEAVVLAFDVSDEALELAASTVKEKANFTLGACTGLSECPG